MDKRIVIVGAGGLGPSIAKEIIEWAQANSIEIVEADPVVTPRDELEAMFKEARFAIDHHVYVVAALQEEAELEFIESILETYDVSIIAMPHSDGVTWFKQKYPKALVYSWQQAQDIDFHRKRAPYIGSLNGAIMMVRLRLLPSILTKFVNTQKCSISSSPWVIK
jgi:hypothetical protein